MTFPKRTFEKPIPISPLIALDRERCILCYRCTRFSENVAEDDQLVARNRGAHVDDRDLRGRALPRRRSRATSIELCPVGALTSTQYRFEARPWEIQNVPTVCGLCPVGCNITATTREGKVKRVLSRNHPEIDGGWLCDKGRFAYPHLNAEDRITEPLVRGAGAGSSRLSWDDALDAAEACSAAPSGRIVTALSGSETIEQAYALGRLLRAGLGAHAAVLPESTSSALDAFRAPLSTIADGGDRRRRRRRRGRRPRAGRRPVAQAGAATRRRGRHRRPDGTVQRSPASAADVPRARSPGTSSATGCAPPSARS